MKIGNSKTIIVASAALSVLMVMGALFGGLLLARSAQPASAQSDEPSGTVKPSQVTVVGTGSITVKPDILKITIGVSNQDETVAAAQGSVDTVTAAMIAKLAELGIADTDYATSQYNVEAVLDYTTKATGTLVGYRVTSMYEITFRDPSQAPAVIDALTAVGANNIYGTFFTVSNTSEVSKQAYEAAIKDAQDRAQKIADLSGLSLGKIVSVSEVAASPYPMPMMRDAAGGGASFTPGQQTISTSLVVVYEATQK